MDQATVRYNADLAALGGVDLRGAVVVDAGCGAGVHAAAIASLGAARVEAIDVDSERIAQVKLLRDSLGAAGAAIHPAVASVFDMPFEDASVDLVLSNYGIGVYRDPASFLREAARVLKPGGAVVIATGNDVVNPKLRSRARVLWRAYELGPAQRIDNHGIDVPYRDQRAALAREWLPDAPDDVVSAIADRTFRHDRDALAAACTRWTETGELPPSPYDPDRAPGDLDGLLVEAPIDPAWMRQMLRESGLRPRVVGYWGGADGRTGVRTANRLLALATPLTLRTAPAIRYVGRKLRRR